MSEKQRRPASVDELAQEASEWDRGVRTPDGWVDAPEAIPAIGASTAISLRVPSPMLRLLKEFARREGVGYQVLIKRWLDQRIRAERDKLISMKRPLSPTGEDGAAIAEPRTEYRHSGGSPPPAPHRPRPPKGR